MRTVVGKLRCQQIDAHAPEQWYGGDPHGKKTVHLVPVSSDDPESEDYAFGKATPEGRVELTMTHEAAGFFSPGDEVYVSFSAEPPTA